MTDLLRVNGINVKKEDVVVVAQKGDDKVELQPYNFYSKSNRVRKTHNNSKCAIFN